jgi:hypothetical protein
MALFKKDPPKACPKCGKADGWGIRINEGSAVEFGDRFRETLRPGGFSSNQFTDMRIQNTRDSAVTYQCSHCGYEKSYSR